MTERDPQQIVQAEHYYQLGLALQAQQKMEQALVCFQQALTLKPDWADIWNELGTLLQKRGQIEAAQSHYRQALQLQPNFAAVYNNLGILMETQHHYTEAEAYYQQALAIQPEFAAVYNNLGLLMEIQSKLPQALDYYQQALRLTPQSPTVWNNLGNICFYQYRLPQAQHCYQQALQYDPHFAEAWFNQGKTYQGMGQVKEAIRCYQKTLQLSPDHLQAYEQLGNVFYSQRYYPFAINCYTKALRLSPRSLSLNLHLMDALREQGQVKEAYHHYEQTMRLAITQGNPIPCLAFIPPIYQSHAEIKACRTYFTAQLDHWLDHRHELQGKLFDQVKINSFYLAYQGLNDLELQCKINELYASFLDTTPALKPAQAPRIRIGFVSAYFYDHSVMHCFWHLIQQLPQEQFSIYIFAIATRPEDPLNQQLQRHSDFFTYLPNTFQTAQQVILAQQLNLLIYPEIGMNAMTCFLALHRLAPIQCVLSGHPVTTGMPTMDYFISSNLLEIPEAQAHYSEQLVRLSVPAVYYAKPNSNRTFKSRYALGLPDSQHLYICPMTLFKVHPDFDAALGRILRHDPLGTVILFRYGETLLHERLQERFKDTLPDVANRICFLPWARPDDFLSILAQADLLLDTFHFGAGNTAYLAFALGTPMVTLPAPYLRGRSTTALYRQMGVPDCIATSPEHYADMAVQIATQPDYRHYLKDKILASNSILYHNRTGIQELIDFWLGQAEKSRG